MRIERVFSSLDWRLVLLTAALAGLGVTFIGSATTSAHGSGFAGQDLRQLVGFAVAAGLGLVVIAIPYVRFMRAAWLVYALALAALVCVLAFGSLRNGARRWLGPAALSVQPSEFAKLAVILMLAWYLRLKSHARTWEGLLVPMAITLLPAVLVLAQPDLSTSLVLWPVWLAMCWAAGAPRNSLIALLVLAGLGMTIAFSLLHEYQQARVTVWLDHFTWQDETDPHVQEVLRGAGFQPWQSLIAIGSGGLSGFGLHEGPQNVQGFLPYSSEDYIFSIVCEELGLLGALLVLGLELAIALVCLQIATRTRERFGRLFCVGVAVYVATQALVHAAVCTWLLPSTGLPMPLVSFGRSSCLTTILALALVLNIGARKEPVLASDGYR